MQERVATDNPYIPVPTWASLLLEEKVSPQATDEVVRDAKTGGYGIRLYDTAAAGQKW